MINAVGNRGRLRFNQMMNELEGISPTTLTETLKELQKEKLIKRESFSEIPPRVEYYLTKDGAELRKAMLPLLEWASRRNPITSHKCSTAYKKMQSHQIKRI